MPICTGKHYISSANDWVKELYPVGNYTFKVNNRDTRTRCEIWRGSGVFIVNFEHISRLVLVFLLLTLSR